MARGCNYLGALEKSISTSTAPGAHGGVGSALRTLERISGESVGDSLAWLGREGGLGRGWEAGGHPAI